MLLSRGWWDREAVKQKLIDAVFIKFSSAENEAAVGWLPISHCSEALSNHDTGQLLTVAVVRMVTGHIASEVTFCLSWCWLSLAYLLACSSRVQRQWWIDAPRGLCAACAIRPGSRCPLFAKRGIRPDLPHCPQIKEARFGGRLRANSWRFWKFYSLELASWGSL